MFFNFVILLALASAVRASVIINVYEDGENKASHSIRGGCNKNACDQLCRRLGFIGGVCVGDRCKCDNFTPLQEHKAEHAVHGSCNLRTCTQMCRALGFKHAACIGDTCRCDNSFEFQPTKINGKALENLLKSARGTKASHSVDSCNFQACDQLCRDLGFPGGACVGDRCDCDNFKGEADDNGVKLFVEEDSDDSDNQYSIQITRIKEVGLSDMGSCDVVACDEMCHRLNYAGGTCSGGSCQCY